MKEEWKDIRGYEGLYRISNLGNVFGVKMNKMKKNNLAKWGYYRVCLSKNNSYKCKMVHKLVAEHFVDNPLSKNIPNHIDGNKLNNVFTNLEWCTKSEDCLHAHRLGLAGKHLRLPREYRRKKIVAVNIKTKEVLFFHGIQKAGDILKINYKAISQCLTGKSHSSGGYYWKYHGLMSPRLLGC